LFHRSDKVVCWLVLILLIGFLVNYNNIERSNANPFNLGYESSGGLIPLNSTHLQMIEANVLYEIDESYGSRGEIRIKFDGNYTIFNNNVTLSTIIGAPFDSLWLAIVDSLVIEVDGIDTNYEIARDYEFTEFKWPEGGFYYSDCAICNVTLTGFSNTTIRYSFDYISEVMYRNGDSLEIVYDVFTASFWNGNITEQVVFEVKGEQPSLYNCQGYDGESYFDKEPIIEEIGERIVYGWYWENERIEETNIILHFWYSELSIIFIIPAVSVLLLAGIIFTKKYRGLVKTY
jgi:hypothetical protein